jgi:hypothetical protein
MTLTWLLIAVLSVVGSGGFLGWGVEHIDKNCHEKNEMLLAEGKQGPLRDC